MIEILSIWGATMTVYIIYKKANIKKSYIKYDDVTREIKRFKKIKDRVNDNNKIFK